VVTLLGIILITTFALVTLIPIFLKKRHVFNHENKQLMMKDINTQKMSTCDVNECVTMTKREFLTYIFSSKFEYEVSFYN